MFQLYLNYIQVICITFLDLKAIEGPKFNFLVLKYFYSWNSQNNIIRFWIFGIFI